jgi:hypothetical protein
MMFHLDFHQPVGMLVYLVNSEMVSVCPVLFRYWERPATASLQVISPSRNFDIVIFTADYHDSSCFRRPGWGSRRIVGGDSSSNRSLSDRQDAGQTSRVDQGDAPQDAENPTGNEGAKVPGK